MPHTCAVVGCGKRSNRDTNSFYRIPAVPKNGRLEIKQLKLERRQRWIAAIKRSDLTDEKLKNARVCEDHFLSGCPARTNELYHPDWVPNQNMGYGTIGSSDEKVSSLTAEQHSTIVNIRYSTPTSESSVHEEMIETENESSDSELCTSNSCKSVQTDLTMLDIDKMSKMLNDHVDDISNLKKNLESRTISESAFENNDEKTEFYTGLLTFQMLMLVFKLVESDLNGTARSSLTKFQKFIFTLMRIRLNLSLTDLAYRFNISKSAASKIFQETVYILWKKLKRFIIWPERETLINTMPRIFYEAFGDRVSTIIDCFEVKFEKSAQVWSNYKQHHTAKFLIGICPQGAITFISSAWGGSISDEELTLNCGILEKLLPRDVILADRGFLISDAAGLYCSEIQISSFAKGKKQLSPVDTEMSRKISNLHIHVEQVIGSFRQKYMLLHSILPMTVLQTQDFENAPSLFDQIVTICCALVNIRTSVIPFD